MEALSRAREEWQKEDLGERWVGRAMSGRGLERASQKRRDEISKGKVEGLMYNTVRLRGANIITAVAGAICGLCTIR